MNLIASNLCKSNNVSPPTATAPDLNGAPEVAAAPTYSVTLLECEPGKRATKLYRGDPFSKPEDYDAGLSFRAYEHTFESFASFAATLASLPPNVFLIRGAVKPGAREDLAAGKMLARRLVYDVIAKDGTLVCPAAFEPCARNWIVLDLDDKAKTPFDPADPEGSVRAWHARLPEDLRRAESAFIFSSSSHRSKTVRGKLVIALSAPLSDTAAAAYARVHDFDGSVCHAVQPNYFAPPMFVDCVDPAPALRKPIMFAGVPTTLPTVDSKKQKPRVALPRIEALGELPTADAGIIAALGDYRAQNGQKHFVVGALAGRMRKDGYTKEQWAAVVGAWLSDAPPGEVDVEKAIDSWSRTFARDREKVSGMKVLASMIGEEHANVVEYACALESPRLRGMGELGKVALRALGAKVEAARAAREAADATATKPYVEFAHPIPSATAAPKGGKSFAALAEYVRGRAFVAYDTRRMAIVHAGDGRRWLDADTAWLRLELSAQNLEAKKETLADVVELVAHENEFDPVVNYLESLPAWDGVTRSAFVQFFGAVAGPWADACWRVFSVSAVARALSPGCKVDTMIVLEGPQGRFKSSGLKALAGAGFFSDTTFVMDSPKQCIEGLSGVWIQEIAELSGLRGRDAERIKASLSSPEDRARLAYGRFTEAVPRRSVFVATRNADGAQWLVDPTGNRRYLPLAVGHVQFEGIARDRDQLWAEAMHRYRTGVPWWLQAGETALHATETDERTESDPWEEPVCKWLAKNPKLDVTIAALFDPEMGAVPTPQAQQTQATANRMARVLKLVGHRRVQVRRGTARLWVYVPTLSIVAATLPGPGTGAGTSAAIGKSLK